MEPRQLATSGISRLAKKTVLDSETNPSTSNPVKSTLSQTQEYIYVLQQKEKDRQREYRQQEREERWRDAERQARLEELRIQAEAARATNDAGGNGNQNNNARNNDPNLKESFQTKLPFLEDKDDIESFILLFERHATSYKWDETTWAVKMSSLLKGQARVSYARMSNEEATDYNLLKRTLLDSCQITAESYREKFRQSQKKHNETNKEYITRLSLYLDRWIEMAEKGGSVKELKDAFLQEQVLDNMPAELVTYVKDREPQSITDVIKF